MRVKDAVGRFGEDLAARHLQASGFALLARNWRCPRGELDIIAADGSTLVFIEVKTRSRPGFGGPEEAVTPAKLQRLRRLAACWLAEQPGQQSWPEVRFDVIAIVRLTKTGPKLQHLRGVA